MSHRPGPVIITGASAGVGRATARIFAKAGHPVGLIARGEERLQAAVQEIERCGGRACMAVADVADAEQVQRAADQFEREMGPMAIWVNNAMVSVFSPAREMQPDEYRRVTEVTYLGYVYGTQTALRSMLPRDEGVIIQVGSALAYRGIPLQSAYCGAKHAIQGYTESLRTELIHDGSAVKIRMVQMPALNTPQFAWVRNRLPRKAQPVPPIYQPELAARAILWAAQHDRDELFVGWPTVQATWANRFFPRLVDRYLAKNGFEGQQTSEPTEPNRLDNLYSPAPGDFAARGSFSDRSRATSSHLWLITHRGLVGLMLAGAASLGAGLGLLTSSRD